MIAPQNMITSDFASASFMRLTWAAMTVSLPALYSSYPETPSPPASSRQRFSKFEHSDLLYST